MSRQPNPYVTHVRARPALPADHAEFRVAAAAAARTEPFLARDLCEETRASAGVIGRILTRMYWPHLNTFPRCYLPRVSKDTESR